MRTRLLTFTGLILLTALGGNVLAGKRPDKDDIRTAISEFRAHPLSPRGRAAAALVREFAEKSDDVMLKVSEKLVPFSSDLRITREDRKLLLAAFIVGNVDSQLLHNEKKDDPYAGVLEVIQTYKRMKEVAPALALPELENFIELEQKGELKQFAESP